MNKKLLVAATMIALAVPALAAATPLESPQKLLGRALAGKMTALASCGAARGSVAKFGLGFDGRVQNVRVAGVPAGSAAQKCVVRELSAIQMPIRLAFIVREISLPLPSAAVAGGGAR